MIDRPDWGSGGLEVVSAGAVATAGDPLGAVALQREMESWKPADVPGSSLQPEPGASDLGPAAHPSGLGHALVREMSFTAEGFDANFAFAAESAAVLESKVTGEFGIDASALNAELGKLPRAMKDKIRRMIWKCGPVDPVRVLNRLEGEQFTLEEQNLAEQALRRLRAKQ